MKFVKIGNTIINLENVCSMEKYEYDGTQAIKVSYAGENFNRFTLRSQPEAYNKLDAFMQSQPAINGEE